MVHLTIEAVARAFGVQPTGRTYTLVPGPNHGSKDRSLSVKIDPEAPDGFLVNSFAGDDPLVCKDYVREKLGLGKFEPRRCPVAAEATPARVITAKIDEPQREGSGKTNGTT